MWCIEIQGLLLLEVAIGTIHLAMVTQALVEEADLDQVVEETTDKIGIKEVDLMVTEMAIEVEIEEHPWMTTETAVDQTTIKIESTLKVCLHSNPANSVETTTDLAKTTMAAVDTEVTIHIEGTLEKDQEAFHVTSETTEMVVVTEDHHPWVITEEDPVASEATMKSRESSVKASALPATPRVTFPRTALTTLSLAAEEEVQTREDTPTIMKTEFAEWDTITKSQSALMFE